MEVETGVILTFTSLPTSGIYIINSLHPFYVYNCSVAAYTVGLGPSDYHVVRTLPDGEFLCSYDHSYQSLHMAVKPPSYL